MLGPGPLEAGVEGPLYFHILPIEGVGGPEETP
jgi:hypothetical protein